MSLFSAEFTGQLSLPILWSSWRVLGRKIIGVKWPGWSTDAIFRPTKFDIGTYCIIWRVVRLSIPFQTILSIYLVITLGASTVVQLFSQSQPLWRPNHTLLTCLTWLRFLLLWLYVQLSRPRNPVGLQSPRFYSFYKRHSYLAL